MFAVHLSLPRCFFICLSNLLRGSGLVVIMHADRFKTSRTNSEQIESCDVDGEKRDTENGEERKGKPREEELMEAE